MVNVYTNNGQFNITESLMEAIKANNPDILLEKETSKDFENRAVDASFNELLKFSVSYVLSELEVGSMKPEDFENFSKNMMNYYSMPKSPEKTHLKAKIKSFLHDVNEKNGTELNFNDIENTIKAEFKDNQTKMKNYSKEDALKFFAGWQQKIAEKSKQNLQESGPFKEPIVTSIEPIQPFYPAEDYHQDFYKKEVMHYKRYSVGSGRAGFLDTHWSKN